jgi:hypothetical protein
MAVSKLQCSVVDVMYVLWVGFINHGLQTNALVAEKLPLQTLFPLRSQFKSQNPTLRMRIAPDSKQRYATGTFGSLGSIT